MAMMRRPVNITTLFEIFGVLNFDDLFIRDLKFIPEGVNMSIHCIVQAVQGTQTFCQGTF